jgi:hypothetical protein
MKAAEWHENECTICQSVTSMLGSKNITATLAEEILERCVATGCPHGGILLPLL